MAGALGRASMEAHCKVTTHFSLLSSPYSLLSCPFVSIRGSIIPPFVLFALFVVSSSSMDGRAQARQPRTALSSLLPIPHYGSHGDSAVRGAPKRASHALLSPPSSLISTTPCSSTLILMV